MRNWRADETLAGSACRRQTPRAGGARPLGRGRARDRAGFTVFELLTAMLLISVLATIAITNLSTTIDKTSEGAAVTDLRNAMSAQEAYHIDHEVYAQPAELPLTLSAGVSLGGGASADGYRLTASHTRSGAVYAVTVGTGSTTEGAILRE